MKKNLITILLTIACYLPIFAQNTSFGQDGLIYDYFEGRSELVLLGKHNYQWLKLDTIRVPETIMTKILEAKYKKDGTIKWFRGKMESDCPVTTVADDAFNGSKIIAFDAPYVIKIGDRSFANCANLETVSIPNVTSIGNRSFANCANLETVSMLNVTCIGDSSFANCKNLEKIELPNVTSIGKSSFKGCSSLREISLPNITSIDEGMFKDCKKLERLSIPKVTDISKIDLPKYEIYPYYASPVTVIVGDSITLIHEWAFSGTGITEINNILKNAQVIGEGAFYHCPVRNITLSEKCDSILSKAFKETLVDSIDIPANVKYIGASAFSMAVFRDYEVTNNNETHI